MSSYKEKDYKVFDLFEKQWALVTAGTMDRFNCCTIGWGSLGTLWSGPGGGRSVVTVYLHPSRYTREFVNEYSTFTVSFFPEEQRKALGILGMRSGRDGDKVGASGLTPVAFGDSVGFKEANLTFLCRKIYQHQMAKEDIAADIQEYYKSNPKVYPVDENGDWQPHWVFVGEILETAESL